LPVAGTAGRTNHPHHRPSHPPSLWVSGGRLGQLTQGNRRGPALRTRPTPPEGLPRTQDPPNGRWGPPRPSPRCPANRGVRGREPTRIRKWHRPRQMWPVDHPQKSMMPLLDRTPSRRTGAVPSKPNSGLSGSIPAASLGQPRFDRMEALHPVEPMSEAVDPAAGAQVRRSGTP